MSQKILWSDPTPEFRKEEVSPIIDSLQRMKEDQSDFFKTLTAGVVIGILLAILVCIAGGL